MNRKLIFALSLMILVGINSLISAQENRNAVELIKGWNLVPGFTSIQDIYGDDLHAENIKAIYAYVAPAQQYVRMYPRPEVDKLRSLTSTYNFDDDIIAASALWVYSDRNGVLGYNYDLGQPSSEKLPLYKGWNFVPLSQEVIQSSQHPDLTLEDIKGNCNIEKVYLWQGKWVDFMTATSKNPPEMSPSLLGKTLVMKVSDNCKLGTPIETVPSVPNLP